MTTFAKKLTVIFCIWTIVGFLFAAQIYLFRLQLGHPAPFREGLERSLPDAWIWAALTPLVFLFAKHFAFAREQILRTLFIHCACVILISLTHVGLAEWLHVPMSYAAKDWHGSTFKLRFYTDFYSDVWMYFPLVWLQNLLDYYRRYREREIRAAQLEAKLTRSQLELLRNQLQPHFLFNALNSISALMADDIQGAEDMLADLSYMLRESLRGRTNQEISLHQELELLAAYLRIQQRRFENRLKVNLQIDPECLEARTPSFLLQPLVENAIRHGIAPLSRTGRVDVVASVADGYLFLRVTDNGVGLAPAFKEGIGLANTRERLSQLYGSEQSLQIQNNTDQGVTVRVTIPFEILWRDKPGHSCSFEL